MRVKNPAAAELERLELVERLVAQGRAIFPCGCSVHKVTLGLCDSYGADGRPIAGGRRVCDGRPD